MGFGQQKVHFIGVGTSQKFREEQVADQHGYHLEANDHRVHAQVLPEHQVVPLLIERVQQYEHQRMVGVAEVEPVGSAFSHVDSAMLIHEDPSSLDVMAHDGERQDHGEPEAEGREDPSNGTDHDLGEVVQLLPVELPFTEKQEKLLDTKFKLMHHIWTFKSQVSRLMLWF